MPHNSAQRRPPAPHWTDNGQLELEIKLLGTAAILAEAQESAFIKALAAGPLSVRKLHNIYYDTPTHWFAAHGLTLRVRADGDRHIQGLKSRVGARDGVFRRWEIEHEIASAAPDIALLKAAMAATAPNETFADLAPVFETRFIRAQCEIDTPTKRSEGAQRIAIAFDTGSIVAGARIETIAEIELELISGSEEGLREMAARLTDLYPLQYGRASKAQRGYRLVDQR